VGPKVGEASGNIRIHRSRGQKRGGDKPDHKETPAARERHLKPALNLRQSRKELRADSYCTDHADVDDGSEGKPRKEEKLSGRNPRIGGVVL